MLCEAVVDKEQLLKTGEEEEDGDDDAQELDDLHIRFMQEYIDQVGNEDDGDDNHKGCSYNTNY